MNFGSQSYYLKPLDQKWVWLIFSPPDLYGVCFSPWFYLCDWWFLKNSPWEISFVSFIKRDLAQLANLQSSKLWVSSWNFRVFFLDFFAFLRSRVIINSFSGVEEKRILSRDPLVASIRWRASLSFLLGFNIYYLHLSTPFETGCNNGETLVLANKD